MLFSTLDWFLASDGPGASDPLALALRDAGATSPAEGALLVALLARSADDEPVADSLLSAALGEAIPQESGLFRTGLVEREASRPGLPAAYRASRSGRERIVPHGLACGPRPETAAGADSSRPESVERIAPRLTLSGVVLAAGTRNRLLEALAVPRGLATAGDWGASEGLLGTTGVALLLHGPPGTGKTLAAEAIAGELGR